MSSILRIEQQQKKIFLFTSQFRNRLVLFPSHLELNTFFARKPYPIPDQNGQSVYPFSDQNRSKTLPDGAAHTYMA